MKLLKDYKGVAIIYLIITVINILFVVNYNKPNEVKQVSNEKQVVYNN